MPPENNTQPPPPIPPPSTELLALARLRQTIAHPLQQCQLTLYVPPDRIGAIIGRGGRTILSIQQEAKRRSLGHDIGVRIHVAGGATAAAAGSAASNQHQHDTNSNNDGGGTWNYNEYQQLQQQQHQQQQQQQDEMDDEWVPVIIRADPIGCLEACRLIVPLVDPRSTLSNYLTIVFDVPIARAKHNLLVGKGGLVLAGLSATYETRIMIPPNELMSNVESTGNIWEQRQQQQQQQQQVVNISGGDDVGSAMLFDVGGNSMSPQQMNAGPPTSNIIQLEGEINNLENLEKVLVRMLGIVAAEESMRFVPTGIIVDIDSDAISTTPTKKTKGGNDSNKASPSEKAVAIIVANASIPSKIWRSIQRKTNTKIQRKNIREEDPVAGDDVVEPSLVNENEDMEGDDDDDEGLNKEVVTDAARPHSKFIITGREQSVQKAAAQIEKILGLEVVSTEITVRDALPTNKGGDDIQPDDEVAPNGEKSRKRRGKKKAAITQPE